MTLKTKTPAPTKSVYGRGMSDDNSSLKLYIREVSKTPLLTIQEENRLADRIKQGDEEAREHMIKANLRLVIKIAKDYSDFGLPFLDLINEGNIGLMKAVERFDPTKGAKFSTYGSWWIKQCIMRALSNQIKIIRLPIHLIQKIKKMQREVARFTAKKGRPPQDIELAAILGVTEEEIVHLKNSDALNTISLDTPLGYDKEDGKLSDIIADENTPMPWDDLSNLTDEEIIKNLVSTLNEREQYIITRRFALDGNDPQTLDEIGIFFDLTRERIRQIESIAIRKLYNRMRSREEIYTLRKSNDRNDRTHRSSCTPRRSSK